MKCLQSGNELIGVAKRTANQITHRQAISGDVRHKLLCFRIYRQ